MERIACIGWGSLIWNPGNLLIQREWFKDGPFLPVEYVRQSDNGRLTLVISEKSKPVRTLWALMATNDIEVAKESLAIREGNKDKVKSIINSVTLIEETDDFVKIKIQKWIKDLDLDAAIWTNLSSRFDKKVNTEPTIKEAIEYLNLLDINKRVLAEEYIRRTPKQIDTEYRRKFEAEFGWTFSEI